MDTTDRANGIGVFRDRSQAELAVNDLRLAGFDYDGTALTEFNPRAVEGTTGKRRRGPSMKRFVVHVRAEGREQGALMILFNHGANNADLPPGTVLVHGSIRAKDAEAANPVAAQPGAAAISDDTFFGEVTVPGRPDEITLMDNPNLPHG